MAGKSTGVEVGILIARSIRKRSAGARFLEVLNLVAPDYSPETYGDREPLKHNFVTDGVERALQCWGMSFLWKRVKPKVTGNAIVGFQQAHDKINLRMGLKVLDVNVVQQLFASVTQSFGIVLAYIHVRTDMDLADLDHYRRHLMPFQSLTTHDLREGIPDSRGRWFSANRMFNCLAESVY